MPTDDGETKVPAPPPPPGCSDPGKCHWQWIWDKGVWTDRSECTTCGTVRELIKDAPPGEGWKYGVAR